MKGATLSAFLLSFAAPLSHSYPESLGKLKQTKKSIASFTFSDLFAGIGGIRIGFEKAGGRCVFSSEYDRFAQLTYECFFGHKPDFSDVLTTNPPGDITKLTEMNPGLVGNHDILTGGFPCQPFSLAGVSKKNSLNRPHGFDDPTQGTLFFHIKEIIKKVKPKAILLENVKHLQNHDGGRTFSIIKQTLDECGYNVYHRVIDARGWVPQHRERIYIVGFRKKRRGQKWSIDDFDRVLNGIKFSGKPKKLSDILQKNVSSKYTLGPGTWDTLKRHRAKHEAAGNGFGYGIHRPPFGDTARTLSARYHKDGAEILVEQKGRRPRRLTPLECGLLMGFPPKYLKHFDPNSGCIQPVSDTQAYRQFGNSVAVPVVIRIAKSMVDRLRIAGAIS